MLLAIGAVAARVALLPRVVTRPADVDRIGAALARLLRRAAMVLVAAMIARLVLHTGAAFGAGAMFDGARLRLMAFDSRWGDAWRVQVLASGALLGSSLAVRARRFVTWGVAASATAAVVVSLPLLGHAAGDLSRSLLHVAHVLGAGLWLGTLGVLVIVPGPSTDRAALLRAFSPLALTGAAVLVPTGLLAAWIYLGSVSALWSAPYGRALALKIVLVGAAAACGYWNWQHFRRERSGGVSPAGSGAAPLASLETVVALGIVLVTSLLTELAHP